MSVEISEKLKPNSELHRKIIAAFQHRKQLADQERSKRVAKWAENEEIQQAYIKETENDAIRDDARSQGQPQYTTIDIPYSYAMMLTLHTYVTNIFLSRSTIFQLMGRHGESEHSVLGMEALLDYCLVSGRNLPQLYVWLLDPFKYGAGIIGHYWDREEIAITQRRMQPDMFLGEPVPGTETEVVEQTIVPGYEGIRLYNVRPQDFYHDPRVPFLRFQEGEFCIRYQKISWSKVKQREQAGFYINIDRAKRLRPSNSDRDRGSPQVTLPVDDDYRDSNRSPDQDHPDFLNSYEFYWDMVPKEWGLGSGERTEKWVFTIAENNLIIGAQPLGLLHGRYPFDVLEFEVNGHSLFNRSVLEVAQPLNQTLTWLFNSHYFNVRKAVNDQFFVDPTMIEIRDLEDPNPGRLVRLKPAAYGKPVDQFVRQFPVMDVTQNNMKDATIVAELLQKLVGANDTMMGSTESSRNTATEVRSAMGHAQSRSKTTAEWFSATGFSSLAQNMIQTTQQLYSSTQKYRIVGDLALYGKKYIEVTPDSITGFYDYVPVDGNAPIDRFAQANLWQQLFMGMAQYPGVLQEYNVAGIFAYVAQLAGCKNINQFRINVMSDEQIMQQVQRGNMAPISPNNLQEPGQIPGMGATG